MEVLLIRHARPHRHKDPKGADPGLTPEGSEQAKRLGTALATGRYGQVTRLLTSPMRRAIETASAVESATGLTAVVDERFAELDQGWPSYGFHVDLYQERGSLLAALNSGRLGEYSFDRAAFSQRVLEGFGSLAAPVQAAADGVTALVCHGGVINVCASHIIGAPQLFFTEPGYTSVTRVHLGADGYRELLSINEVDHLRDL